MTAKADIIRARRIGRKVAQQHAASLWEGVLDREQRQRLYRMYGPPSPISEGDDDPLLQSFYAPLAYWSRDDPDPKQIAAVVIPTLEEHKTRERKARIRGNPGNAVLANPQPRQFRSARKTFEEFNDYDMEKVAKFARPINVPDAMYLAGPAVYVLYRSDKWNDGTHDYIHRISSFPDVPLVTRARTGGGELVRVPKRVREAETVAQIGLRSLGYAFTDDDGNDIEVATSAKAQWFWSKSARALYCIENKRKLIALLWGGKLDVEPRGIVG